MRNQRGREVSRWGAPGSDVSAENEDIFRTACSYSHGGEGKWVSGGCGSGHNGDSETLLIFSRNDTMAQELTRLLDFPSRCGGTSFDLSSFKMASHTLVCLDRQTAQPRH